MEEGVKEGEVKAEVKAGAMAEEMGLEAEMVDLVEVGDSCLVQCK